MNYEFWFYAFVWFIAGYFAKSCLPIYVGYDPKKYDKAGLAILLRK